MKYITLIITMVIMVGCKDKESGSGGTFVKNSIDSIIKFDTVIRQDVWYDEGKYHLQTYVLTKDGQLHPKKGYYYLFRSGDEFCPYYNEVSGTFEYVKQMKPKEYTMAEQYFHEKKKQDSIIESNLHKLRQ